MPKETLPKPRVEVFQYLAYHGGFAQSRTLLWMYMLVNSRGERRYPVWDHWSGHPEKEHALRHARDWSRYTGWPLVDRGRVKQLDQPDRNG